jgi:hypothetical protein
MSELLQRLSGNEIVTLYNHFALRNGSQRVTKFRNRKHAEVSLQDISRGVSRPDVLAIFRKAKISKEVIKLIPDRPVEIAVPETESRTTTTKKSGKTPNPMIQKEKKKEEQRWVKESKKEERSLNQERRKLNPQTAEVLKAIQQLLAKSKEDDVSTDLIAKHLSTSTAAVCKAVEQLDRLQLVKFEDDSPTDETKFYYVKLTAGGSAYRPPKEGEQKSTKAKLPAENPGPRSHYSGKKLYRLVDKNPRREGTCGWKSFALIKDGMTYEQYKAAGGRNSDLAWDIAHGFTEVK